MMIFIFYRLAHVFSGSVLRKSIIKIYPDYLQGIQEARENSPMKEADPDIAFAKYLSLKDICRQSFSLEPNRATLLYLIKVSRLRELKPLAENDAFIQD